MGIENHHIQQGILSLPEGIGACGTVSVEEFVAITKSRGAVLHKRHHGYPYDE